MVQLIHHGTNLYITFRYISSQEKDNVWMGNMEMINQELYKWHGMMHHICLWYNAIGYDEDMMLGVFFYKYGNDCTLQMVMMS